MILGEVDPVKENQAGPQGTDSHYKPHAVRKEREMSSTVWKCTSTGMQVRLRNKKKKMNRLVFCGQKESACTHSPFADDCDKKWR